MQAYDADSLVGPARAGMILNGMVLTRGHARWPRTSGDDPYGAPDISDNVVLAPHERG